MKFLTSIFLLLVPVCLAVTPYNIDGGAQSIQKIVTIDTRGATYTRMEAPIGSSSDPAYVYARWGGYAGSNINMCLTYNHVRLPNGTWAMDSSAYRQSTFCMDKNANFIYRAQDKGVGAGSLPSSVPIFIIEGQQKQVGINQAAPSYSLDVNGDGRFTSAVTLSGGFKLATAGVTPASTCNFYKTDYQFDTSITGFWTAGTVAYTFYISRRCDQVTIRLPGIANTITQNTYALMDDGLPSWALPSMSPINMPMFVNSPRSIMGCFTLLGSQIAILSVGDRTSCDVWQDTYVTVGWPSTYIHYTV